MSDERSLAQQEALRQVEEARQNPPFATTDPDDEREQLDSEVIDPMMGPGDVLPDVLTEPEIKKDIEYKCGIDDSLMDRYSVFKDDKTKKFIKSQAKRLKKAITLFDYQSDKNYDNVLDTPCDVEKEIIIFFSPRFSREFEMLGEKVGCEHSSPRSLSLFEEREGTAHNQFWYSGDHTITTYHAPDKTFMTIKDRKDRTVAFISSISCSLFISVEPSSLHTSDRLISLMQYVLDRYSPPPQVTQEDIQKLLKVLNLKTNYQNFVNNIVTEVKRTVDDKVDQLQREISNHYRGLQVKSKEILKEEAHKTAIMEKMSQDVVREKMLSHTDMLMKMMASGRYNNFEYTGEGIIGITPQLYLHDKKYDLGIFKVTLFLDGRIKCTQQMSHRNYEGYDHPHVNHGDPCWGNLSNSIPDLIRDMEFPLAFDFMYDFLTHYNPENPYAKLFNWRAEDVNMENSCCSECRRTIEYCRCDDRESRDDVCENCDRQYEDCTCPRCPIDDEDLDDDIGCATRCQSCDHNSEGECTY